AMGALTVGIVTKPFEFEGRQRLRHAEEGLEELREAVDTLIVIPNQRLLAVVGDDVSLLDSFRMADEVLLRATRGISELITVPALINLDFADVRTVMAGMGDAIMGTGEAIGEGRAIEATNQAISSPLLEDVSIAGARGVLISFTGGRDLSLREVSEAANLVCETAGPDAHIIFGAMISEEMEGNLRVTVVATGVGSREPQSRRAIPVEKRVQEPQPVAPSDDWDRPAFRRREGFLPRWKSGQGSSGNPGSQPGTHPGGNPNLNQKQETKNRQEVKNRLADRPKTKSGRDDLDRPTFLRAHAD
ncbi:MAG: cell division protein FtsZ, partial [Gemmatimonadetes bacterium]|nr:cell division protein FtsZ [Gemmatimonadota bacterium]